MKPLKRVISLTGNASDEANVVPIADTQTAATKDDPAGQTPINLTTDIPKLRKRKRKGDEDAKTDDIESRYLRRVYSKVSKEKTPESIQPSLETAETGDEIDPELIQHETLTPTSTSADKTIFISNVPVKVLTSKPHLRSLKQLFSVHGQIASIRFRSIAFTNLVPRKVAFITKQLHPERDTLNAYIVYENSDNVTSAIHSLNGSLWEGKHLRVDSVSNPTVTSFLYSY